MSHTIYLEKEKLYYIEGVEKQHGGLGHLSVGVVLPSDEKIFPISKKYLKVGDVGVLDDISFNCLLDNIVALFFACLLKVDRFYFKNELNESLENVFVIQWNQNN